MAATKPILAYPGEGLLEEEQTVKERESPGRKVLSEQALLEPIQRLFSAPPVCVAPETSVAEAVGLMQKHHHGCVLVRDASRLVGIFTERDVLNKVVGSGHDPARIAVETVMTPDPETLPADASVAFALNLMSEGGFRHIPVVDDAHRPIGVLSVRNIVQYLAEFFPEWVLNVPPRSELLHPDLKESG